MKKRHRLSSDWYDPEKAAAAIAASGTEIKAAWTYAYRNQILREIGYGSYAEYLESDLWRQIRERRLRSSRRCFVCRRRKKATQCHHTAYTRRNLLGETLAHIVPICGICHYAVEFHHREKLSFIEARRRTYKLKRWKKWPQIVAKIEAKQRRNQ